MPKKSPFYSRTAELCQSYSWQEWSGFLSANLYELEHTHEYYAIRTAAALIDVSPLYKYHIHGPDALALLNRVVTRDVAGCAVGQVMYTPWCDDEGKIIDDGTLARLDDTLYRLTAADPTLAWLQDNAFGLNVQVEDVSEAVAAVALQGPMSRRLLKELTRADLDSLKYFCLLETELDGIPVTISRTGYTGDLGYEIWLEPGDASQLWDALMGAGHAYRLRAAGNLALDMARIEAGLLLINVDFNSAAKAMFDIQKSSPLELGLGWTVKLAKEYFVGQSALKQERARGPTWHTVGLEVDLSSLEVAYREFDMPLSLPSHAWNEAVPVYDSSGTLQIGKATSGTWSPILKKYVALARVRPRYARPGTRVAMEVTIEAHRRQALATVVKTPFFDPARKRE